MTEPWTAEQREWLEAMGHTVWSIAPAEALAAERQPESPDERGPDERGREAPAGSSGAGAAMREAAALLAREERPARPAPARPAPARAAGGDRLMQALMRASGGADEARVRELAGDLAALRGNAAAKRALWPRLRALRRTSRG